MDTIDTSKHFSRYGVCVLYSLYSKVYYYASSTLYSQCTVQRGMKAACSKALLLNGFTPFKEKKRPVTSLQATVTSNNYLYLYEYVPEPGPCSLLNLAGLLCAALQCSGHESHHPSSYQLLPQLSIAG